MNILKHIIGWIFGIMFTLIVIVQMMTLFRNELAPLYIYLFGPTIYYP